MGPYELFILGSIGLLTLIVILLSALWKNKFAAMQGMIISMFFGMNVGLTAGVLFGVVYRGDLYTSTMLSIAIGVVAGSVCGSFFGMISILEGLMAGLMGGMMGAMVGEMISSEQSVRLVQLFLYLSISTVFIILILRTPRSSKVETRRWYLKPLLLFGLLFLYVSEGTAYIQKVTMKTGEENAAHLHQEMLSKESVHSQEIFIEARDMDYSKKEIVVQKDKPIRLQLINFDSVDHDIEMELPYTGMVQESDHPHASKENRIHLHAGAENFATVTFTPIQSGVFRFVCSIPGHAEVGMIGKFVVD